MKIVDVKQIKESSKVLELGAVYRSVAHNLVLVVQNKTNKCYTLVNPNYNLAGDIVTGHTLEELTERVATIVTPRDKVDVELRVVTK